MHNIFESLRADHDNHRTLLEQLAQTEAQGKARRELLRTLRNELESHAAAEERCLYAHMLQDPSSTDVARHGIAEHHDIDKAFAEFADAQSNEAEWRAAFETLRHRVEHHLEEEEHGVFQLAGKVLSDEQKIELAAAFQVEKHKELARRL